MSPVDRLKAEVLLTSGKYSASNDGESQGHVTFPVEPPLRDVVIRVWGSTPDDADDALDSARRAPGAYRWRVVEVVVSSGPPCMIPSRDLRAIAQAADYDSAWAAYPTAQADGPRASAPASTPSANPTPRGGR